VVPGRRISAGETLQDALTGARSTVLGLEFATPVNLEADTITLVVERTDPSPVAIGRVRTT
jgi:hypothetical protein